MAKLEQVLLIQVDTTDTCNNIYILYLPSDHLPWGNPLFLHTLHYLPGPRESTK